MKKPFGLNLCKPGQAILLLIALYSTKQAGRMFFDLINKKILDDEWVQFESDPCMFSLLDPVT